MKILKLTLPAFLASLFLATLVLAQPAPMAQAEMVGLSTERLAKVKDKMQWYIDEGKLGSIVSVVARKGKVVHMEGYGTTQIGGGTAVTPKTIFRIFSMSKPIVSVALMTLYEDGKFHLDDPVAKYIPSFGKLKVYDNGKMVDLERPMTVEHLLTHTSGLSYGWNPTPVDTMYAMANIWEPGRNLEAFVDRIATLPLNFQPGARWEYGVSTDVVGRLVEVISGQPLDKYLQERIFTPLGMVDSGFFVPKDKLDRLATVYAPDGKGGIFPMETPLTNGIKSPTIFFSGGGGLASTPEDYLRFAQMLVNGGEFDGQRILGKKTVELMLMNHLPDGMTVGSTNPGAGFGLGFMVTLNPAHRTEMGSIGEGTWSGLANTFFWVDPKEELVSMVFTQFLPHSFYPLHREFKNLVYQSIID
ncbi:MAG: beta-lactamase family protein [Saprospiraceae bacterium]|nr:beta-lactamase family protein [Saprospiraceae bacterium]